MTPEKAAGICEVPVEDIYQAARRYATAKPATIAWGLALDQNQNGNQAGQCIVALMAITGNVDVPGGQIIAEVAAAPVAEAGEARRRRGDQASDEAHRVGIILRPNCRRSCSAMTAIRSSATTCGRDTPIARSTPW